MPPSPSPDPNRCIGFDGSTGACLWTQADLDRQPLYLWPDYALLAGLGIQFALCLWLLFADRELAPGWVVPRIRYSLFYALEVLLIVGFLAYSLH